MTASREVDQPILTRRRIYLMRHADVSYFDERGNPVRPDSVPLTEKGKEQAAAARKELAEVPIDRVVCSGLPRTLETATSILGSRELAIESLPEIREIEPGKLADLPLDSLDEIFLNAFSRRLTRESKFLGGETFGSLCDRVLGALESLIADSDWRHLLIVAHGGVNRAILTHALGAGLASFGSLEQDACCLNILDVDERGNFLVRLLNHTPYNAPKLGMELTTMERIFLDFTRPGSR